MKDKVEDALKKIRPALQADGGDVELVDVADGIVKFVSGEAAAVVTEPATIAAKLPAARQASAPAA